MLFFYVLGFFAVILTFVYFGRLLLELIGQDRSSKLKKDWCMDCKNYQTFGRFCIRCGKELSEFNDIVRKTCENCGHTVKISTTFMTPSNYSRCSGCGGQMNEVKSEKK